MKDKIIKKIQNEDIVKRIKYYKELGYNVQQSFILGLYTYNDFYMIEAIQVYKYSEDFDSKISFCNSLYEFTIHYLENNEIAGNVDTILTNYIETKKTKKYEKALKKERDEFNKSIRKSSFFGNSSIKSANLLNTARCCYSANTNLSNNIINEEYMEEMINLESLRYDNYNSIEEKGFNNVLINPTSTFRTTCNTASMGIIKNNFIKNRQIDKSMVRIEELMNYFEYNLKKPTDKMIEITAEVFSKDNNKKLLFVGLQGKNEIPNKQNIVLLLDVSGSMGGSEVHMQASIFTILSKLNKNDNISLITYSSEDHTIFENLMWDDSKIDDIIEKFLQIQITGCTYGSKGLEKAYDLISKNKIENGLNKVVILTDGDFNFGIIKNDGIEKFILEKKKTGAYLSIIGTGTYNLNDHLMETLAKNGNGNYFAVNGLDDVDESINKKYNSLMHTIATDVKVQVEFNPKHVKSYRLLGYENRQLSHEDFKNDKIISEPFSSGSYTIALYEIETNKDENPKSDLKYQNPMIIDSDEICTIKVRYKELNEDKSKEISCVVNNELITISEKIKLAYIIYMIGEKLRNSEYFNEKDKYLNEFLNNKDTFKELINDNGKLDLLRFLVTNKR